MLHIISSNKPLHEAYERFAEKRGIQKALQQIESPAGVDPIKVARERIATAKNAFGIELQGDHLKAFRNVHGSSNQRAYIIVA